MALGVHDLLEVEEDSLNLDLLTGHEPEIFHASGGGRDPHRAQGVVASELEDVVVGVVESPQVTSPTVMIGLSLYIIPERVSSETLTRDGSWP
jgi:hypothetical protein